MSHENVLRVVAILSSTREGRFGPIIAEWFLEECVRIGGLQVELVDLAEARLPETLGREPDSAVAKFHDAISKADAFVIITPEYNHSFPAPLKTALDWSSKGWAAKPVGFVSYGGNSGGLRAVEHLRQVFIELHAAPIRDSVCFNMVWEHFNQQRQCRQPERHRKALTNMMNQLRWWARHLRIARAAEPYLV